MNKNPRVITYAPQDTEAEERPASDMGTIRRGLWIYTHKLGLNFSLVLFLALCYQAFMAVFIGMNGVITLPIFKSLRTSDNTAIVVLGNLIAILVAGVIQGLIIAEMAQVVWLRHPDRLKVRLMSGSIWWWIMLVALILTIGIDFLLLFLSITGAETLAAAWQASLRYQMNGLTILLLAILNFLTLLRCASVMRTSTSEEIRKEVEARLKAIAEEILIDAGDSARQKASKVWKKLSVDPQRFVPIHDSVLNLISSQHPNMVPPELGGSTWAYDFSGNTFAALPADLHQALLQNRYRATNNPRTHLQSEENQMLWKLPPTDMAEMIGYNLDTYGQPKFVDITEPDQPKFMSKPIDMTSLGFQTNHGPLQTVSTQSLAQPTDMSQSQVTPVLPMSSIIGTLQPMEKALFSVYLSNVVFPAVHHTNFPAGSSINIFDVFDEVDLQYYFRFWKKNGSVAPVNSMMK